jgi:hypothetical protein
VLAFADRIARKFHQGARAKAFAEELRRQVGQLVRLVDDEGLRTRQDLAEAFLFQRKVGEQQVMVHDDDVGRLRARPRLHDETLAPERAFAAQAVVGGAGHHRQQRRILGQGLEFGQVAHARAAAPRDDALELRDLLAIGEARLALGVFEAVLAQVVRAALEQCGLDRRAKRIAHAWQVAEIQLVLQRARAGGHDGLQAGQQRGHEVGVGLARAGAGFGEQRATRFERIGHGHRQALLRGTRREGGNGVGECAALGERIAGG